MPKRKKKVRIYVFVGVLLATATILASYHFVIEPIVSQAELADRQLEYVTHADPEKTTALFVVGHEHGPDYPASTWRTVTDAAQVKLLLSATEWTIQHGSRERWNHFFHSKRLTFRGPAGECVVWFDAVGTGWSFGERPHARYSGGFLLHLVFGVVYLAAGHHGHFYLELKGHISTLRYLSREDLDAYSDFLIALAPLVTKIEANPETPLDDFWEFSGLSRDDWASADIAGD